MPDHQTCTLLFELHTAAAADMSTDVIEEHTATHTEDQTHRFATILTLPTQTLHLQDLSQLRGDSGH